MINQTSSFDPISSFKLIENAAIIQFNRLLPDPEYRGDSRAKGQKIDAALSRLCEAIMHKYKLEKHVCSGPHLFYPELSSTKIDQTNLSTIDSMLRAKMFKWEEEIEPWTQGDQEFNGRREGYYEQLSLRQALNISRNHPLNMLVGTSWGPVWGKTKALAEVEEALHLTSKTKRH